jgi:phage protein D
MEELMSALPGFPPPVPQWTLTYQGVNITADISTMTIEIIYTDRLGGASGDLAVALSDETGLWSGPWAPAQGDVVSLALGYANGAPLPCGDFQVDDLCYESPPDILNLRCLSTYITPAMRTRRNIGYENQNLSQIAAKIAQKYGLNLIAQADATNVSFARITQSGESDLAFLHRIALAYDYDFTIRGGQLIFYSRAALESAPPVATLARSDVIRASFRIKSHRTFQAARVSYQSPYEKSLITQRAASASPIATGDSLVFPARCENGQQALLRAQGALHQANMVRATAAILTPGSAALSAGNTVAIAGFGVNDGVYMISTAAHRVNRHLGYVTELSLRKVESPTGALN